MTLRTCLYVAAVCAVLAAADPGAGEVYVAAPGARWPAGAPPAAGAATAAPATGTAAPANPEDERIRIRSKSMVAYMEKREIVATGDVVIDRGTLRLMCDRAVAYLDPQKKTGAADLVESINRIVATGNVKIKDAERNVNGRSTRLEYDRKTELMIMSGPPRPQVSRAESLYIADAIKYNRKTGTFALEGLSEVEILQLRAERPTPETPPREPW